MKTTLIYTLILFFIIIGFIAFLIVMQIEEYKLQDDPILKKLRKTVAPIFKRKDFKGILDPVNTRDVMDEITLYKGDKSYTINKQKVFLCLRDEKDDYYNFNMLLYVLLHEISHVICDEVGHTDKFSEIFDAVLEEATTMKIYDPNIPVINDYCQYEK